MKKIIQIFCSCLILCGSVNAQRIPSAKRIQVGQRTFELDKIGHYFVLNGDIIMGDDFPKTRAYYRTDVAGVPVTMWPQGYIPVKITDDVLKWDMYKTVIAALTTLTAKTNARFKPYAGEPDYIQIEMNADVPNFGGMSAVGKRGGPQVLLLGRDVEESVVIHELLHAIGFWHEQSRSDRDQFVKINFENVSEGHKHNFQIEPGLAVGEYDYNSIMHYSAIAFNINGKRTIQCKKGDIVSDCKLGGHELSVRDIAAVNAVFTGNTSLARLDLAKAFNVTVPVAVTGLLQNGIYRIKVINTAKYLDVKDISKNNGAVLQQWDAFTEANQQFAVMDLGNNVYVMKAMHSGKYLSVDKAGMNDLATIVQWDYVNQNNQKFYIRWIPDYKGYIISNVASQKYFGLLGLNNGGLIIQQEKPQQVFAFEKTGEVPLSAMPNQSERTKPVLPANRALEKMKKQ